MAQIRLRSSESSTLKITWFAPSRSVFAYYHTIFIARDIAAKLDGKEFGRRKMSAKVQEPGRNAFVPGNFTVSLGGFPVSATAEAVKQFCRDHHIDLGDPNYEIAEGRAQLRAYLERYGFRALERFDCPLPNARDLHMRSLVRFVKPEEAAIAAKILQGKQQIFLGSMKTWVSLFHSIKYNVKKLTMMLSRGK